MHQSFISSRPSENDELNDRTTLPLRRYQHWFGAPRSCLRSPTAAAAAAGRTIVPYQWCLSVCLYMYVCRSVRPSVSLSDNPIFLDIRQIILRIGLNRSCINYLPVLLLGTSIIRCFLRHTLEDIYISLLRFILLPPASSFFFRSSRRRQFEAQLTHYCFYCGIC